MATFSLEQLNFFKFSSVVLDEFPIALRQVFVHMWDNQVAPTLGFQKWDDSPLVRNMFLSKEGGRTKYVPTGKSFYEWDCTALFEATLYAQSFAIPDGSGGLSTLHKLYVKPRHLPSGTFHPVLLIPGNEAETFALALDQLRLLRNALCHQTSTQKIDKTTFDYYIKLTREAFFALKQDTTRIDEIGKLEEGDFPTARLQKLEEELKKEKDVDIKFKQISDHLNQIESQIENVRSDLVFITGSTDLFVPKSSIPDELPNFVGRDKECKAVEHHLTDEVTRLVNVWGPPGFGKTSVAIRVAHHLQEKNFPVYFASVRAVESMEDLVSKLLRVFVDDKQVHHITSSDLVIQCLQQIRNPFVLILDNADDLFESEDAKRKQHVLRFIEEILTHCKHVKLLLTTRESLDYLTHKLPIFLEKINVLDEISSAHLVRLLLPDASEGDCKCVVKECGNVPMSMRLMCSIIKEANISINVLLDELSNSTIVEVLNSESFPDEFRLKSVINTSFKRLMIPERDAFVSLSVFPEWFGIEEAQAILNVKSEVKTKQIIRSLERKSLIHCGENFSRFTVHSLLRSFIKEEVKNDEGIEAVFLDAQLHFYDYYTSRCKVANENFLIGRYSSAFRSFLDQRECIISSLSNAPGNDITYTKAVDLLSEAKSFLYVALHGEKMLFERLYNIAIEEAKRREKVGDEEMLLSAKEFPLSEWYQPDTAKSYFWLGRVQLKECGNVPMSMRLMCSIIKEANISINVLLDELSNSTIVEVLNSESFPDDFRLKSVINTSFERLMIPERDAFVSLSVFPEWFGIEEAQAILNVKSEVKTKQIIRSLERKSLIHCGENFSRFTVHSLLRSFIKEEVKNDEGIEAVFLDAQLHFYAYYTSRCKVANKNFLIGRYSSAFRSFLDQRECIISSLSNGPGNDITYTKVVDLLSEAKSFLYVALHGEKMLFERLYDIAIEEAKRREKGIGDREGALDSFQRAANMRSNLLGDHKDTASSYYWLGQVQRDMGDLKGAMDSLQRAANMRSNLLGDHKETASSYYRLGQVQRDMGDLKGAMHSLQRAANMRSNLLGDHEDTMSSYYWLGQVQCDMGHLKGAMHSFQRAANMRSNLLGDHEDTASSYYWLGQVQRDMGDLKGAMDSLQRAANMRSNLLCDHKDTANSYHSLGKVQRNMRDLKGAMDSLQRAGNMRSNLLGDHEDTASSYYWLGQVKRDMGDLKGAMDSLQRAANIRSNLLGDHKDTAFSYYWLGFVQRDMGDLKGALDSLQRAANMESNLLGDHEDTAYSFFSLGLVQRDMGDLKGALDSLQRAANMRSNLLGDHEDTASSYYWLGQVQRDMGDLKGAMDSLQRAANMRSNLLVDHEETASSYHFLGLVQRNMGDLKGAMDSLQRAANMRLSVLGDHKDTASSFLELSLVQKKAGDLKSALESVQVSLRMTKELLGDHLNTAESFYEQGFIHFAMGDFNSAVESLQKAADMNFNLRRDHINTATNYHSLGMAQVKIQDCEGALDSLQKAIQIKSNLLGDHEDTASSYHELGSVQRDTGDLEGALDSLQKAANMRSNLLGGHKDTASSYHELGVVQHGMGDLKGALESLQKALDMRTNLFGKHGDTMSSLNELRAVQKKLS
ncbi:unnamed protein product [Porites evermanni]|uniref:NACHT domain-containing protein n=1 Tax=Porites evermanni TaxID=104178 RepID=A0ABN8SUR0_9CNID|nr:unnamed protein product [Porites evermanni]